MDANKIRSIYDKVRELYSPITVSIMSGIADGTIGIDKATAMFPPDKGATPTLKEAETGFLKHNCAIITAFRNEDANGNKYTFEENLARNESLKKDLDENGIEYCPVIGWFTEVDQQKAFEVCFLLYEVKHDVLNFFTKVFNLSEKYSQDSFLFKTAGMHRTAYYIQTNDAARNLYGDVSLAGQLYLGVDEEDAYTNCCDGKFTFKVIE